MFPLYRKTLNKYIRPMKKYVLTLALLALPFCGQSQAARQIDSAAVYLLDRMADIIGELEAVSFVLETATDRLDDKQKIETHYSVSQVSMEGPDKMVFQTKGDKGKIGFWYFLYPVLIIPTSCTHFFFIYLAGRSKFWSNWYFFQPKYKS